MQKFYLYPLLAVLLNIGSVIAHSAQLASAKVISINGTASFYDESGSRAPLTVGTILTQGDHVTTAAQSDAMLVFSNGSELTIEENSSIVLAELAQQRFFSSKRYEQLQADPSQSQTQLELNYGSVYGHVKKLHAGSAFNIETILGTAMIRGTQFKVKIGYNAERGEFILIIHNKDGKIDLVSRYSGNFEYGRGSVSEKGYQSARIDDNSEAIPPAHIIVIRLSEDDPGYPQIVNLQRNFAPSGSTPLKLNTTAPGPVITPADITIISDEVPLNN